MDTFGRPKPGGVIIDPNNALAEIEPAASHARHGGVAARAWPPPANITRRFRNISGRWTFSRPIRSRTFAWARPCFYQKNYQAAANAFRSALGGDLDPKWMEVWSHIYIGKIYDLLGQRERAVNEYSLAQHRGTSSQRPG